jgi:hypothetical protein
MTQAAPATNRPTVAESRGIELVGYHDLDANPAFKLAMQEVEGRWLLYTTHFWRSSWSVVDVTDPTAPALVRTIDGPPDTWTYQIQVADGRMVTALERPSPGWGFDPSRTEQTGVVIWDVATDPVTPARLAYYDTGGRGTHRNHYDGGRYAYLACQPDGYQGNIFVALDLQDPSAPVEASRWWWPGQWVGGGETPEFQHYLHGPPYVVGDLAYLSYGRIGMVVLDISDRTAPELVGRLSLGDFGSNLGCHSAVPYGNDVVVVNDEAIAERCAEPLNYAVTVDVADPSAPRIVGWLPAPRPSGESGYRHYRDKGGRFGPHNQHHGQGQACLANDPATVHLTYFNAGLRIYDISDPRDPRETAFFVPSDPVERHGPKPETALVAQSEDVLVDARGNIFLTDKNHGLFVLRRSEHDG